MRKKGLQLYYKAIEEYKAKNHLRLAKKIQNRYANIIKKNYLQWNQCPLPKNPIIGGIDLSYLNDNIIIAGIVIIDDKINILDQLYITSKINFPYIPGYLAFRELDPIIKLFKKIKVTIDILCFDGQGIAHPRFLGIATYGGLLLNIPSIGIGKSKLIGTHQKLKKNRGSKSKLIYQDFHVGWVLRSKTNVNPIYISPGWKIPINKLPEFILNYCIYRIPEPTRLAHNFVNKIKKSYL
jgi:deoxyribonuclease V